MNVTCLALEPDGGMKPEAEATTLAGWRAGAGPYWIHLTEGRPESVTAWLAGLGLDPGLLELLRIGDDEPRILPLADAVLVAYPVPGKEPGTPGHFGILCIDRLVITVAQPDASSVLEDYPVARLKLREGTAAGVVCALAVVHSARLRRHVVTLRAAGDALADRMDSDPWAVSLEEILALKRRGLSLGGVVDEQLAVLQVLKASDLPRGRPFRGPQPSAGTFRARAP